MAKIWWGEAQKHFKGPGCKVQTPKTGSNAESASYKIEGRQVGNFDVISNLESKPTTAATTKKNSQMGSKP